MHITKLILSLVLVGLTNASPQYPQGTSPVVEPVIALTECAEYTHACVPYYQCDGNGYVNTDGTGLIDVRVRDPNIPYEEPTECTNLDYPEVPAVCCRIPGATVPTPAPVTTCPGGLVCVENGQCNADGTANTDGAGNIDVRIYSSCYVNTGGNPVVGVCCQPPPLDLCYNNQVCLPAGQCAVHSSTAVGSVAPIETCFIDKANYVTGVCCDPPIRIVDVCPGDSVCIPEILCQGDILDEYDNYVPYGNTGTWSQCPLSGDISTPGVCCRNPVVTPPPYQANDKCGVSNNLGLRTYVTNKLEKNEAQFAEFPWQAVVFFSNLTFKCGASLVADRWLITGAHCLHGYTYGDFKVRLGEWEVNAFDEPLPYYDADIKEIYIHPEFNSKNLWNDFAVIELIDPVPIDYHINTVCLPRPNQALSSGTRCYATGWGKDAFDGNFQHILKKVDVPFVESPYCQELLRKTRLGNFFLLNKSFMCAGGEQNIDACTGDGGGPLVCPDPTTGQFVLWGITAWGIGCGQPDVPAVYADVQFASEWISNIIYKSPVAEVTAPGNPYGGK